MPVGRPITEPCGTEAAAKRHIRNGEKIKDLTCGCREAYNAAHRAYYAKRMGKKQ